MFHIGVPHDMTAQNVYVIIRNTDQQVWNGSSFEDYNTNNYSTYPVDASELGTASQFYAVELPATLPAGVYSITFYAEAGSAPGEGDTFVDFVRFYHWDGTQQIPLTSINNRLPSALVGGNMDSNISAISGTTAPADAMERMTEALHTGSVDTATFTATTTVFETDLTEASDDHFNKQILVWDAGTTNAGLSFEITDSEGTTTNVNNKVKLTTETMPNIPADTDTFVIFGKKAN